jgi:hypothetical protein
MDSSKPNISQYYLDLDKVNKLEEKVRETIHNYYRDMLYSFHDNRSEMCLSILDSLLSAGYLVDKRSKKLDDLLDGNEG